MSFHLRPLSLAILILLASAPFAQGGQGAPASDPVLDNLGITSYTLQDLDLPARPGDPILTSITLDGLSFTLELWPSSVRSPDFTLMVQEADGVLREHEPAAPRTYRGTLLERPGTRVAASLLDDGLTAQILFSADHAYTVQPASIALPGSDRSLHVIYADLDVLPVDGFCATDDSYQAAEGMTQEAGTGLKLCDIAFDTDVEFYQDNGSSVNNTVNDIENILNGVANIYESDCNITYELSFLVVRTSNPDPYTTNDPGGLLGEVGAEWSTNQIYTQRDIVHLMTGRNLSGSTIGIAYLGAICSGGYIGTGLSQSTFTSNYNSRVGLTAHELGHNWNASHCSGGSCRIMCSSLGGCSGILTSFGNSSINAIVGYAASRTCILDLASPLSIPFEDTFDVSGLDRDKWIYKAYAVVNSAASNPPTGIYALNLDAQSSNEYADNEVRSNYILLGNESDVTLTYHTQHRGVDSGEELIVEYLRSNGNWSELNRVTSNGTDQTSFTLHQHALPNNAYHNGFRLRFRVECDQTDDDWFVDDIALETIPPCPSPTDYGTGKINSIGTLPLIGYTGTNSYTVNDFALQLYNARPNQICMPFWSVGPYNGSILGGTLLVAPPLNRTSLSTTDVFGIASHPLTINAGDVGLTRYYQWFFRDPGHPDGTNAGLSNALEVPYCN